MIFLVNRLDLLWRYAIVNPGVNALRGSVYNEIINVVNDGLGTLENDKFDENQMTHSFENYRFTTQRPITKSMFVWWSFIHTRARIKNGEAKLKEIL